MMKQHFCIHFSSKAYNKVCNHYIERVNKNNNPSETINHENNRIYQTYNIPKSTDT